MQSSPMTMRSPFSLCNGSANSARLALLRCFCAVAEGAQLCNVEAGSAAACVSALLGDAQGRLCILGGRESMPRSLGSVYGGGIVQFLGGFRGVAGPVIRLPDAFRRRISVSRDGSTLFCFASKLVVSDRIHGECALHAFRVSDGTHLRTVGSNGAGPLQFSYSSHICVSADDYVLVAEKENGRVQVLTSELEFHSFVGVDVLNSPTGVCGDSSVIAVCQEDVYFIHIFSRSDGGLIRRFGTSNYYGNDGRMKNPYAMCLLPEQRHIAVLDSFAKDICVFTLEGRFIRRVKSPMCSSPRDIACSDTGDEIIVADSSGNSVVLSAHGELLIAFASGSFTSVASRDGTIFAQKYMGNCHAYT